MTRSPLISGQNKSEAREPEGLVKITYGFVASSPFKRDGKFKLGNFFELCNYLFLSFSYFLGGGSLFAIHNECEVYNPRSDRWASLCPMTSRRSRAGVTSLGKLLYVVGGYVMHFIFHLVIHFVHLHILRAQSFTSLMADLLGILQALGSVQLH